MDVGHDYRIKKLDEIQLYLKKEIHKRQLLSEKYFRIVKWINNIDAVLIAISMGLGATGIGLLSTIVAVPAVVALESVALGTGVFSIIGKYASKKLSIKALKHEKITVLAEAKLNSIRDHVSKALNDGKVSDQEFSVILSELKNFQEMKHKIVWETRELIDVSVEDIFKNLNKP